MATETIDTLVMETNIARAILAEAAAGDYLQDDLPEDEDELLKLAEYYVNEAQLAFEAGMKDEHILAIINLSRSAQISSPANEPADLNKIEGVQPGENPKYSSGFPPRSSGGYSESDLREADVRKEGLPIPQSVEEAVPHDMPTDLTDLGDKAVRRLHSAFNAYLGRARWLLALATSNLANATHLRDEEYRKAYLYNQRKLAARGEKPTQNLLEALSKDSEEYINWNKNVQKHTQEVTNWKALVEIYGGNVDRLSREWSMRTDQYERER